MHYPRIPREYWRHRLQMARAMGLNTVSTYVFWNLHEPEPGKFDFSENADVPEFCRVAQAEGLKVILRPGPYVCAEWDGGGLPWWLLREPGVVPRSRNPAFVQAVERYFKALGEKLAPLQVSRGGPIIMVQVENEYGSYGRDTQYLAVLRDTLRSVGFDVPLFTPNLQAGLRRSQVEGVLPAINFGSDPAGHFRVLREVHPEAPLFCGEYFTGWFDSWGEPHHLKSAAVVEGDVRWMVEHKASFNLYMVHGGTTFGFWTGANTPPYRPELTSYDYDAPISEAGWPTPKYLAMRKVISQHLAPGESLAEIPPTNALITVPNIDFAEVAPLLQNVPKPVEAIRPRGMESFGQGGGYILYETELPPGRAEQLRVKEVHDYAVIIVGGRRVGSLDRRLKQSSLVLPDRPEPAKGEPAQPVVLQVLVEALGRVNYGREFLDRKGITEKIELVGRGGVRELTGWKVFTLPMENGYLASLKWRKGQSSGPAFHRATFQLGQTGDTFLDMSGWGKGAVWVNGHNLGRYWCVGPQKSLYCPGPWLKQGANEVIVLDIEPGGSRRLEGVTAPVWAQ
jgi:beta-galactosidase